MRVRSDLFARENLEIESGAVFALQNSRLLRARITASQAIFARKGAMVAYQGNVEFAHKGSDSVGQFFRKMISSDDSPLMTVRGDGDVFMAAAASHVHLVTLEGDAITVNGANLLAFTDTLSYDITKVAGAGMLSGGVWNTQLSGHGQVALVSDGEPVVLDCSAQATYTDVDATVAWSAGLTPTVVKSFSGAALIGRGSGEAFQYAFSGQGFVVVQPSEGPVVPPHSH